MATPIGMAVRQPAAVYGIRDAHVVQLDVRQFAFNARLLHEENAELLVYVS